MPQRPPQAKFQRSARSLSYRHLPARDVVSLQLNAEARPREIGPQMAVDGPRCAVENELLDAGMSEEVLQVDQRGERTADRHVDRWRTMGRERQRARPAQRPDTQELAESGAAGRVGLEDVDCACLKHPPEVRQVVAVLARGDRHPRRPSIADLAEPVQVVRGNRLLEPADTEVGEPLGESQGLLALVRAIGIDEERYVWADRRPGGPDPFEVGSWVAPDLHLDHHHPVRDPAAQLSL